MKKKEIYETTVEELSDLIFKEANIYVVVFASSADNEIILDKQSDYEASITDDHYMSTYSALTYLAQHNIIPYGEYQVYDT